MSCNESLLKSAVRSFLRWFFAVLGFGVAVFALSFGAERSPDDVALPSSPFSLHYIEKFSHKDPSKKHYASIVRLDVSGFIGAGFNRHEAFEEALDSLSKGHFKSHPIKALVLVINSTGGTVYDSEAIFQMLMRFKTAQKIPIYSYIDGICASGGYYIACASDAIFCHTSGLVGSIGVVMTPFFNLSSALDKIGIYAKTVRSGEGKDLLNPVRPWSENEEKPLQNIADYYYERFCQTVVTTRPKISLEALKGQFGAGVFPAGQALEHGYVDEVCEDIAPCIKALVSAADLEEDGYELYRLEQRKEFFEELRMKASTFVVNALSYGGFFYL